MPKAFLMKKKAAVLATNGNGSPAKIYSPPPPSLPPPPSSSGIASPISSSRSSSGTLSPRNDENRFESPISATTNTTTGNVTAGTGYSFFKNDTQCLDLSIKSLLKESNLKRPAAAAIGSTFVSSYPYPAKFAKIADFLRINENSTMAAAAAAAALISPSRNQYSDALNLSAPNSPPQPPPPPPPPPPATTKPTPKPLNHFSTEDVSSSSTSYHHHHRLSPYSINWSEHFSVNKIIASPTAMHPSPAGSHRSIGSDSGRSESSSIHSDDTNNTNISNISSGSSPDKMNDDNSSGEKKKPGSKTANADRYHCPDCNKSYSTASGLAKHQEFLCTTQVKKSFSCKHCEKIYYSLGALKMHIRTHTLPCKCSLCGKAFSRPWLLQGHIRTHTGEKPFACQYCNRAFADRSNLRAHLQTHSVVKKYSCKCCSRTFSRMSLLLKHEDNGCSNSGGGKPPTTEPHQLVPVQG